MFLFSDDIRLNSEQVRTILGDPEKSADAVDLVYVSDRQKGITRKRKGKGFIYTYGETRITDPDLLARIRKLVIPPAWDNVWICRKENGHLQATGLDLKKRKQYRYHPLWNSVRNHTKFYRLHSFGACIPKIRKQIKKHLSLPGLPQEKVLAAVLCLMESTCIRIGNSFYEKLYGSFGLTTLKDRHVRISGNRIRFSFRGKKGIQQDVCICNRRLAGIVRQCRDIPGKELFQYKDPGGEFRCVDSGMVNDYIRTVSGGDFTAKDFRTWAATVQALIAFKETGPTSSGSEKKSNVIKVLDTVARRLGNTRSVCRKYYVHPLLLTLYENGKLQKYLAEEIPVKPGVLTGEEQLLMRILKRAN